MTKLKFILLSLLFFLTESYSIAQDTDIVQPVAPNDTIVSDSTKNVPTQESDIKNIINYDAVDSIYFDVAQQQATLYGRAHVDYEELEVDAPKIIVDLKNNRLEAIARTDSNGKVIEYPLLKQGQDEFQAKRIIFDWTTNRGYIEDVYMQEGEGYIHTNEAYLDEDKNLYVEKASYTTCNLAQPHYHFKMRRAKVIPEDKIIASMVNLYIDSIPTPLGLPFGLFPTKDTRSSGILLPNDFGEQSLGYFIKGFGYYWSISDRVATQFVGEIYSKGTFGVSALTNYKVRYRYSGNLDASYRRILTFGDEFNSTSQTTYKINWKHNPVSRNGRRLSANVNYQDGSFNRFNFSTPEELSVPNINSSINITLPLRSIPFSATIGLRHDQRQSTEENVAVNTFNLPNFTFGYVGESNLYKKLPYSGIKPSKFRTKVLEQFNISYNMTGNNYTSTSARSTPSLPTGYNYKTGDTLDFVDLTLSSQNLQEVIDRNKFYMTHSASISNNLKLKAFTLTPSFSYNENWYFNQTNHSIDNVDSLITATENPGFYRISRYNFSTTLSTTFYNFYSIGRVRTKTINETERTVDKQLKFRQTIQPRVGFSMSPDYSEDQNVIEYLAFNGDSIAYNKFLLYQGRPSTGGIRRSVNFGLNNTFEMKLPEKWSKKESDKPVKPISLLNLNASTSYNLAADSLKLSNIVINATNSKLFGGLASINANAVFDPYTYDSVTVNGVSSYQRVDRFWAENNGFSARLSSIRINSSLNLSPKIFKRKQEKEESEEGEESKKTKKPESPYLDFNMPWTLNLRHTYSWTHANPLADTVKNNTLTANGTLKLSEKWSTSFNVNYNITTKEFSQPNISINRDLHCWEMSFRWTPFGPVVTRNYTFHIGVKAAMLKDLKYKRESSPYNRI